MDELDIILTEQLHSARARKKLVKRLRKLMPTEPGLNILDSKIDGYICFLESMIRDNKVKPKRRINIKRMVFKFIVSVKFIYLTLLFGKKKR